MYYSVLAFITSFTLTYLAIPSIIHVAIKKNLTDEPGERRSHSTSTPSLGGIGIFAGTLFSILLWTPFSDFADLQYVLCSFIIIFLIGAKDDIDPMSPSKKFLGELFAAAILVFKANVKLTSLHGIFGYTAIPEYAGYILSIFVIIVIINAFNLVDGINGLSGGLGALISVVFGTWFYFTGEIAVAVLAFALAGSLIAFLKYNITPAKIFMGDTGALLVGLVCSILTITFIENHMGLDSPYAFDAAPAMAIAILILPLFDTLRVFIIRLSKGKSPFHPDRNHIHHMMIDAGLTHTSASAILIAVSIAFMLIAFYFQNLGNLSLIILLLLAVTLTYFLFRISKRKQKLA